MKPIITGIVFVGGVLILIGSFFASSDEDESNPTKELDPPEGDQVNLEEIRRLRRELRHELKKKKKPSAIKDTK